jgi:hypothetical protein
MKVQTVETMLSKLVAALAGLDATQFDDSTSPWQNVASVFDTLSLLPKSVKPPRLTKPLTDLASSFVKEDPALPLFYLSQYARGFSMPNFKFPPGLKYITEKWKASFERDTNLITAVELLEAHTRMPTPDAETVKDLFIWISAKGDTEVRSYLRRVPLLETELKK